jgi:hypothetical protein
MVRLCIDVVLQVCSLCPSQCEPFLRLAPLGRGVTLVHRDITSTNVFYSLSSAQNSVINFETQIVIKFNF